jgi:xanthine/CO dehydrogenase XdhC/CoxF family maturation factor
MDRREKEQLLATIRAAQASGEPVALTTVVRVRGSAYRREGTRMVVRRDGTYECALSGGCLEPVVADAAARVIATGDPRLVTYDLADDSVWGLGIGCTGAVDVRIERLGDDELMTEWLRVVERDEASALVTRLSEDHDVADGARRRSHASDRLLVWPDGRVKGSLGGPALDREAARRALDRVRAQLPSSGTERFAGGEFFIEVNTPAPGLVVFGAGYDAVPLARLAWALGLDVTIVDPREAFLTADRFPNATRLVAHASEFQEAVVLTPATFVVVMNHHIERDRESLRFALRSAARYIGVLGPRARLDRLMADLDAEGYVPAASALSRVRSPIGLSLGAETPAEVALSVLGEILAIVRGFEGGFLTGWLGSLHQPADTRALARS